MILDWLSGFKYVRACIPTEAIAAVSALRYSWNLTGITCLNVFCFLLKFSWNLWVTEGCRVLKLVTEWRKIMSVSQTAFCVQRFRVLCITKCSTHTYWVPPIWKELSQLMSQELANTEQCTSKRCFEKDEEETGWVKIWVPFWRLSEECRSLKKILKAEANGQVGWDDDLAFSEHWGCRLCLFEASHCKQQPLIRPTSKI